ncbi:MAG: SIS domain-containing protein [Candidatus Paceibacterota bacterium]|jgi:D-sedoheptulose 7-phosphate isomerase
MKDIVSNYINDLNHLFVQTKVTDFKGNKIDLNDALIKSANMAIKANSLGNKMIFIGNGGSAATASHKALDYWFTGKIRGIAFSDHANLTCVSNDFGYQNVFVKQIEMFADKGDILFAISSSGNSENIILAIKEARKCGCKVFTFSGFKEANRIIGLGDLNFYTPVSHFNKVESIHLLLCDCILEIILEYDKSKKK